MINYLSFNQSSLSPNRMSSSPTTPSSFFSSELKRALSEQIFGISGYKLGTSSSYEANAKVDLLEGAQMLISLSYRGFQVSQMGAFTYYSALINYKVTSASGPPEKLTPINPHLNSVFETIEALLERCSPEYASKRAELLYSKLMS